MVERWNVQEEDLLELPVSLCNVVLVIISYGIIAWNQRVDPINGSVGK